MSWWKSGPWDQHEEEGGWKEVQGRKRTRAASEDPRGKAGKGKADKRARSADQGSWSGTSKGAKGKGKGKSADAAGKGRSSSSAKPPSAAPAAPAWCDFEFHRLEFSTNKEEVECIAAEDVCSGASGLALVTTKALDQIEARATTSRRPLAVLLPLQSKFDTRYAKEQVEPILRNPRTGACERRSAWLVNIGREPINFKAIEVEEGELEASGMQERLEVELPSQAQIVAQISEDAPPALRRRNMQLVKKNTVDLLGELVDFTTCSARNARVAGRMVEVHITCDRAAAQEIFLKQLQVNRMGIFLRPWVPNKDQGQKEEGRQEGMESEIVWLRSNTQLKQALAIVDKVKGRGAFGVACNQHGLGIRAACGSNLAEHEEVRAFLAKDAIRVQVSDLPDLVGLFHYQISGLGSKEQAFEVVNALRETWKINIIQTERNRIVVASDTEMKQKTIKFGGQMRWLVVDSVSLQDGTWVVDDEEEDHFKKSPVKSPAKSSAAGGDERPGSPSPYRSPSGGADYGGMSSVVEEEEEEEDEEMDESASSARVAKNLFVSAKSLPKPKAAPRSEPPKAVEVPKEDPKSTLSTETRLVALERKQDDLLSIMAGLQATMMQLVARMPLPAIPAEEVAPPSSPGTKAVEEGSQVKPKEDRKEEDQEQSKQALKGGRDRSRTPPKS
jgi:hypothetical protein